MAKRFVFRLATLLRVRQLREREAKRNVAAKRAEIARLDRLAAQTAAEISRQQAELLAAQRQTRLDPPGLQRGRAWLVHLRRLAADQQVRRAELVRQLHGLQAAWQAARTQTRTIEKLRQRRWQHYAQERARQEQAQADELAQQLHRRERETAVSQNQRARRLKADD